MLPRNLFYDDLFDMEMKGMNADVYLKDGMYHLELDLPGFKKDEISIDVHKGTITIKASKTEQEDSNDKKYIRKERKYQKVERSFYFVDMEEDDIKANFTDGTLYLTIPQKQEEIKKQISID